MTYVHETQVAEMTEQRRSPLANQPSTTEESTDP